MQESDARNCVSTGSQTGAAKAQKHEFNLIFDALMNWRFLACRDNVQNGKLMNQMTWCPRLFDKDNDA